MLDKVFMGAEPMTIDDKGRVGIPSRFVDVLKKLAGVGPESDKELEVGVAISPSRTIRIVPIGLFEEEIQGIMKLDPAKIDEAQLINLASLSHTAALDKQNRIRISARLLEMIKPGRNVIVSGHFKYMQIDNDVQWQTRIDESLGQYAALADKVARAQEAKARPKQFTLKAEDDSDA